ncbi:hypothetical protein KEM56_001880 [Ascosphaera pollenicola]|nr:hypothetical protein KEM56_001880 [Ascosphaera pollenicola]
MSADAPLTFISHADEWHYSIRTLPADMPIGPDLHVVLCSANIDGHRFIVAECTDIVHRDDWTITVADWWNHEAKMQAGKKSAFERKRRRFAAATRNLQHTPTHKKSKSVGIDASFEVTPAVEVGVIDDEVQGALNEDDEAFGCAVPNGLKKLVYVPKKLPTLASPGLEEDKDLVNPLNTKSNSSDGWRAPLALQMKPIASKIMA